VSAETTCGGNRVEVAKPFERLTPLARARARLSQSWSVYGRPVSPPRGTRHALMHAARTRLSATVVEAQLYGLLRRPRGPLPSHIARSLTSAAPEPDAVTWIAHYRPTTRRSIVHELGVDGRLLSVVKIGAHDDEDLRRERAVLEALATSSSSERGLVVPTLLSVAETEHELVLRTHLELAEIRSAPYRWNAELITLARRAIGGLHDRLAAAKTASTAHRPTPAPRTSAHAASEEIVTHGDLTAWNVFLLGQGHERRLAVIDYEDVGVRPPWWDATRLLVTLWTERRLGTQQLPAAAASLGITRHEMLQYVDLELRVAPSAVEALTIPLSVTRERLDTMQW
jgi:phosphotransferase family enzyme